MPRVKYKVGSCGHLSIGGGGTYSLHRGTCQGCRATVGVAIPLFGARVRTAFGCVVLCGDGPRFERHVCADPEAPRGWSSYVV